MRVAGEFTERMLFYLDPTGSDQVLSAIHVCIYKKLLDYRLPRPKGSTMNCCWRNLFPRALVAGVCFLMVLSFWSAPPALARVDRTIQVWEGDPTDGLDNQGGSSGNGSDLNEGDALRDGGSEESQPSIQYLPIGIWTGQSWVVFRLVPGFDR